jgi:hypothetical protein
MEVLVGSMSCHPERICRQSWSSRLPLLALAQRRVDYIRRFTMA